VRSVVVADVVVVMINTFLSKGWLYLRVDQGSAFSTARGKKFGEISIGLSRLRTADRREGEGRE
jgi:hypothetical protein